jgi:hypothetical protein
MRDIGKSIYVCASLCLFLLILAVVVTGSLRKRYAQNAQIRRMISLERLATARCNGDRKQPTALPSATKIHTIVNIKILKNRRVSRLKTVVKKSISFASALSAVLLTVCSPTNPASAQESKHRSWLDFAPKKIAQSLRQADTSSSPDRVYKMPGEVSQFPTNADGSPFVLDIDTTVNFTDALNRFYYDPKWRGEVWVPFNQWTVVERATRLMSTWPEYDEFSQYRKLNHVHKFFERYSGFGP